MSSQKTTMRLLCAIAAVIVAVAANLPVLAATVTGDKLQTFSLSRQTLVARVESNMRTDGTYGVAQFFNVESLKYDDLLEASTTARLEGAKIHLCFDTLIKDRVTARLLLNPSLANSSVDSIKLYVDISENTNKSVREKFEKQFGQAVAVMKTGHSGSFGMKVVLAGKLDISKMDSNNLYAYYYDEKTNKHQKIADPLCYVDEKGFVFLAIENGGYIIITNYNEMT